MADPISLTLHQLHLRELVSNEISQMTVDTGKFRCASWVKLSIWNFEILIQLSHFSAQMGPFVSFLKSGMVWLAHARLVTVDVNCYHVYGYGMLSFDSVSQSINFQDYMSLMPLCESPDDSLVQRRTCLHHDSQRILRRHFTIFSHIVQHLTRCEYILFYCTVFIP